MEYKKKAMNKKINRLATQVNAIALSMLVFMQQIYPSALHARQPQIVNHHLVLPIYANEETNEILTDRIAQTEANTSPIAQNPSGPDQPEVQSFTPIEINDMVDPFTGDFSYNIPLIDVDGYPINLAYQAGVSMDEEASWVGLGWNVNPGVINRAMRGYPDEFNGGDKVVKEYNVRNDFTMGVSGTFSGEVASFDIKKLPPFVTKLFRVADEVMTATPSDSVDTDAKLNMTFRLGANYNSYAGYTGEFSVNAGLSVPKTLKTTSTASLGISGSSQGGVSVDPSFSQSTLSPDGGTSPQPYEKNHFSIGSSFNTRQGLTGISYSRTSQNKRANNERKYNHSDLTKRRGSASYNFGSPVFTPGVEMGRFAAGGTFSFKFGGQLFALDGDWTITGYYTNKWLRDKKIIRPVYGYFNLHSGQNNEEALLDFSRENDGPYSKNTPALAVPILNFDLFNASGQGISGSYRPIRTDIGYVFDPTVRSHSVNGSLGIENAAGNVIKLGFDIQANYMSSANKAWRGLNQARKYITFQPQTIRFREANEMANDFDQETYDKIGGSTPVRFKNGTPLTLDNAFIKNHTDEDYMDIFSGLFPEKIDITEKIEKRHTEKRNQLFSYLTREQLELGMGIQKVHPNLYKGSYFVNEGQSLSQHPGEITILNEAGARYVYAIPAYNKSQKVVTFSVDRTSYPDFCANQLVSYSADEASINNESGTDHLYDAVSTPAYAHSFMLTNILNSDYSDLDAIKGPSKDDLGGYVKFSYNKIDNYKWKNPSHYLQSYLADYLEGMHTDLADNKANYTYGEKELWYVNSIETKNHILFFYTSDRLDGHGVTGEHGVISASEPSMQKLDSIVLYAMPDYEANGTNAVPLKRVHLEYDYSLCPDYAQNIHTQSGNTGKLTLKKVYFTYQKSHKGRRNPYTFVYSSVNPSYNLKSSDRWGVYKEFSHACDVVQVAPLRPSDFPYVGYDKTQADEQSSAWNLSEIHLPSGGYIQVSYESDDYGYVQHKAAEQMMRIVEVEGSTGSAVSNDFDYLSTSANKNLGVFVELNPDYPDATAYVKPGDQIYFKALMNFKEETSPGNYGHEFVPGYAIVSEVQNTTYNSLPVAYIKFEPVSIGDHGPEHYNPIAVAAIHFARNNLSRFIPPSSQTNTDKNANPRELATALIGSLSSLTELFSGPNKALYDLGIGTQMAIEHSWLRLGLPNGKKLGGGHRVKEVRIYDAWDELSGINGAEFHYGQQYDYTLENGQSSGVAAYEPQIGSDENSWKTPLANNRRLLLAADIRNYMEEPFGESYFPSPTVGYSRVTVKNLERANVKRHATGKVVHEFYTAKDFPTITDRTKNKVRRLFIPSVTFFLGLSLDEMSASQGFVLEKNDMHGKPKAQYIYAEDHNQPISSVQYHYLHERIPLNGQSVLHLKNEVTMLDETGNTAQKTVGMDYDAVADFRESSSGSIGATFEFNTYAFVTPFPVNVPPPSFSASLERTSFKSATFTKVIQRFGILDKTVATDLGSVVETKNLAYDAQTGQVLVTKTTTNFNDAVYSLNYPAYWHYTAMGPAWYNQKHGINAKAINGATTLTITDGVCSELNSYNSTFTAGDEVWLTMEDISVKKVWVKSISVTQVEFINQYGIGIDANVTKMVITRSGRRNQQGQSMATLVSRENPLNNIKGNLYAKVLNASAVEYAEGWRIYCNCADDPKLVKYTTNPYVLGKKGMWRPKTSYVHLTGRTQNYRNTNTNIRQDGFYKSYTPFYKLKNSKWVIDRQNWTSPSSITEFSPTGLTLETKDALGRYGASTHGYNQTLPIAVGVNSRYEQLGFDGFEDYAYDNCSDTHFKLTTEEQLVQTEAHTGHYAVKLTEGDSLVYQTVLIDNCEPASCTLDVDWSTESTETSSTTDLDLLNVQLPVNMDYELINGNPNIKLKETEDGLVIVGDGTAWKIRLYVVDQNGCTLLKEVDFNP